MSGPSVGRRAVRKARWAKSRLASGHSVSIGRADPDFIFIAGTGRSGTTWLAELLARNSRRRLVFEPFRNDRVPLWEAASSRQYIRPGDADHELLDRARAILSPHFRNEWADYYNGRLVTRGRIVKDIRANLILRWLYDQLGPFPIVFVIRHPGAVAASWLREGWSIEPSDVFLGQSELIEDHLAHFAPEIATADDVFEKTVYSWCIETIVPLRQFARGELDVVFYENLVRDPHRELNRLLQPLGEPLRSRTAGAVADASATTTPGVVYASRQNRLHSWQARITASQMGRLRSITTRMGLGDLYGDDGMPCEVPVSLLSPRPGGSRRPVSGVETE